MAVLDYTDASFVECDLNANLSAKFKRRNVKKQWQGGLPSEMELKKTPPNYWFYTILLLGWHLIKPYGQSWDNEKVE